MKFCTNCGTMLQDEINVCPNCGIILMPNNNNEVQQMYQQPVMQPQHQIYQQPVMQPQQQMYQQQVMQPQMQYNQMNSAKNISGGSFIMKIIFEILAIVCGIIVAVSIFMPTVEVESEYGDAEITAFEALTNTIDILSDMDFEDVDYDNVRVMLFALSALLPVASIAFGVIYVIAKLIGLIKLKSSKKVKIGGLASLLSLQFFYYYLAEMLVFTDKDELEILYDTKVDSAMGIGWIIPLILVSVTMVYGIVINLIENFKTNKTKKSNVSYIVTVVASIVLVIVSVFATVGVKEEILKIDKVKMQPSLIVVTSVNNIESYDDYYEDMDDEYLEARFDMDKDELLKDITMFVVYMAITLLISVCLIATFTGIMGNGILGIATGKFRAIGSIISSTLAIVLVVVDRFVINAIGDLDYLKAFEAKAKATSTVTSLTICAAIILVISVIVVILQNTAFKEKNNNNMMMNNYNYQNQGYNPGMPNMMQ